MRSLQSDEVIAAVGRGPEHHAIAWYGQSGSCSDETGDWQGRAIGVEQAYGIMTGLEQRCRRVQEAFAEARAHCLQQADALRQNAAEEVGAAGRSESHEARYIGE